MNQSPGCNRNVGAWAPLPIRNKTAKNHRFRAGFESANRPARSRFRCADPRVQVRAAPARAGDKLRAPLQRRSTSRPGEGDHP